MRGVTWIFSVTRRGGLAHYQAAAGDVRAIVSARDFQRDGQSGRDRGRCLPTYGRRAAAARMSSMPATGSRARINTQPGVPAGSATRLRHSYIP